jgi:8-oxo-dGTP diphosphatase
MKEYGLLGFIIVPMSNTNYPMHIVAAGGLVMNSQGQVLLIKSPRYGDWEFPGGQVEEGETIPHALEREVFEETGIFVQVKSLVGIYSNTRKPSIVNLDFICEYVSGEPKISIESTAVEWVDREEALSHVKREAIYKRLKNMLEFSGEITYRAYFVDPTRLDLNYQELEDRKI